MPLSLSRLPNTSRTAGLSLLSLGGSSLGFSAFFVANYMHVIDLVPVERRGWALGIYGVSGFLGTALAPVAGEIIVRRLGFPALFVLSVQLGLVAAWLVIRMRGILPPRMGEAPGLESLRAGLAEVLRLHMALAFFFGLGTGAMFTFLPTFGEALGVHSVSLFYTAYAIAAVGVRVAGGNLIDTRGRRAMIGRPSEAGLRRGETAAWWPSPPYGGAPVAADAARFTEINRQTQLARLRYHRAADRAQAHRQLVMNGELLNEMLTAHFRSERAIDAARRFISRNVNATLRTSEVVEFLRRRREQLREADIEYCATEAMNDQPATFSRPPRVTAMVKLAQNQWRLVRPKAGSE